MKYLKDKGFGGDEVPEGYDSKSITKFLVERGYCSAESAASSLKKNKDPDLGFVLPKLTHDPKAVEKTDTTRAKVKPPAGKRKYSYPHPYRYPDPYPYPYPLPLPFIYFYFTFRF
jgi:hypothetical protein